MAAVFTVIFVFIYMLRVAAGNSFFWRNICFETSRTITHCFLVQVDNETLL